MVYSFKKNEFVTSPQGDEVPVLDTNSVDKSGAQWGRKSQPTLVIRASGGEKMGQSFKDGKETYDYIAEEGDAIFVNSETDMYVPPMEGGKRLKIANLVEQGYAIAGEDQERGGLLVKLPAAQLLVEVVQEPVCIKNAWGPGEDLNNHQFLYKGATLKVDPKSGAITGINSEGFEKWELLPEVEFKALTAKLTCRP